MKTKKYPNAVLRATVNQKKDILLVLSVDQKVGDFPMSEIDKIHELNAAFEQAMREGDGDKCALLCDEAVVMMPPNKPPIEGREAIRQHVNNLGPDSTLAGESLNIEVHGRLAYQRSRATWSSNGKTKYTDSLEVLKQQDDGSWLFLASSWNSSEGFEQE